MRLAGNLFFARLVTMRCSVYYKWYTMKQYCVLRDGNDLAAWQLPGPSPWSHMVTRLEQQCGHLSRLGIVSERQSPSAPESLPSNISSMPPITTCHNFAQRSKVTRHKPSQTTYRLCAAVKCSTTDGSKVQLSPNVRRCSPPVHDRWSLGHTSLRLISMLPYDFIH